MTVLLPQPVAPDTWATATWPLGPSLDQRAGRATFAVFAPDATRVTLEIWTRATGGNRVAEIVLAQNAADGCWRGEVVNVGPGVHYGFRCWGPNWPFVDDWAPGGSSAGFGADVDDAGHRFNPNKLLFDPYGRELSHTPPSPLLAVDGHDDGMFGTGGDDYHGRPRREFDTGPWAPKSLLIDGSGSTGTRPRLPAESTAVYEAHVKNLTLHPSSSSLAEIFSGTPGFEQVRSVPESLRGTYAGAALMAPYLKALGFTTIELMPVHETSSSELELSQGKANHWGYQSLSFFAPNRDYAHDRSPGGPTAELKAMVKAFHDQGLEVYLDVVYNHTAEGGNWGGDLATTGFTSLGGFSTNDYPNGYAGASCAGGRGVLVGGAPAGHRSVGRSHQHTRVTKPRQGGMCASIRPGLSPGALCVAWPGPAVFRSPACAVGSNGHLPGTPIEAVALTHVHRTGEGRAALVSQVAGGGLRVSPIRSGAARQLLGS